MQSVIDICQDELQMNVVAVDTDAVNVILNDDIKNWS